MKILVFIISIFFISYSWGQEIQIKTGHKDWPTAFIYNLGGLKLSQNEFINLKLDRQQIRGPKIVRVHECERFQERGELFKVNQKCIDTILMVYKLKSHVEVNGNKLKTRKEKKATLSTLKQQDILSMENIRPNEVYDGYANKKGLIKIRTKH